MAPRAPELLCILLSYTKQPHPGSDGGMEFVLTAPCPVCRAVPEHRCIASGRDALRWFPHPPRVGVVLGRWLVDLSLSCTDMALRAQVHGDLARAEVQQARRGADQKGEVTSREEILTYQSAQCLQDLVGEVLRAVDGRTIELEHERAQSRAMKDGMKQAEHATRALHGGLTRPAGGELPFLMLPTPEETQVWQELHELNRVRAHVRRRNEAVAKSWPHATPEQWQVTRPLPNGVFHATRQDGFALEGWAESTEFVAELLRGWTVPTGTPVAVTWDADPSPPSRQLPYQGREPGHPANVDGLDSLHGKLDVNERWEAQLPPVLESFAAAIDTLRQSWSLDDDIEERLAAHAAQLNTDEPQAPRLHALTLGRERDFGVTTTTAWIDPAAIAETDTPTWNDFADHRPHQCASFTRALLASTDPADTATTSWGRCEPVRLVRVPGPAGPLYEQGQNGMHRIHTAQMLGFPLLWAIITQYPLPATIR